VGRWQDFVSSGQSEKLTDAERARCKIIDEPAPKSKSDKGSKE
jgi:hypothetical protein